MQRWLGILVLGLIAGGCALHLKTETRLPSDSKLVRDQLVIHSDFYLPRRHRLVDELTALRIDIGRQLALPLSDEPIHLFLFQSRQEYLDYMTAHYPEVPERRAWFVETDTRLAVYAFWGDRIAEDLRHESAHGYLHSVVPQIPLWLDEGLAEYFEVPRGREGLHAAHLKLLRRQAAGGRWKPDLPRLEKLQSATELSQQDYAEAWAWAHLMLKTTESRRKILQEYLARIRMAGSAAPFAEYLAAKETNPAAALQQHLRRLAEAR